MSISLEFQSHGVADTLQIGGALGKVLEAGDVVALVGCLGAGKTHLCKGIAVGLGVPNDRLVNSPTFVFVNEYHGRFPIYHVDAYRLTNAAQLEAIGFEELCASGGVVLVEWADRVVPAIPADALWIELAISGDHHRRLILRATDSPLATRLKTLSLDR